MRLALKLHPDSRCDAVEGIDVEVVRGAADRLTLWYTVMGRVDDLVVPPPGPAIRADMLWETTCFEFFLKSPEEEGYREFNFSPSSAWADYSFGAYRREMTPTKVDATPIVSCATPFDWLEIHVTLPLGPPLSRQAMSLAAVIEETNGRKSYWALAHPAAKPDFHHPDSFVHELP